MRVKVYQEKCETKKSFVVFVLPEDLEPRLVGNVVRPLHTNFPKHLIQRIAPCEYEIEGFLVSKVQEHLESHGYYDIPL